MNNKTEMSSTQQEQEQGLPLLNNGVDTKSLKIEMSEGKTGAKRGSLTENGDKFPFQVNGTMVYPASRFPREGGPKESYSLTLEFDDESRKNIELFQEKVQGLIFDNHKSIFGKSYSKDQKSVVIALCNGFFNDKGHLRFNIQTAYNSKKFSIVIVSPDDESETVSTFEELESRIQRNMLVSIIGYIQFYFDRNGKLANSFVCEAVKIRGEGEKKEYQKKDDVVLIEDLDVSSLKATKPQKNDGGKLKSEVSLNGSKWMKIRLSNLLAKFGVSTGMASDGQSQEGSGKHSILACFEQEDSIYEQLKKLDAWALEHGTTNSEAIFDKKLGPKLVEGKYNRSLNEKLGQLKDGTEATFYSTNLSLYTRDGNPNIKVVDSETGTEIPVATFDDLNGCFPRGTRFDAVVRLEFWYYLGKFGLKMYVKELHIVPRSVEKKSFVFRSGSEEDSAPTPASAPLTRTASASAPVDLASRNSDEEESCEESGDEVVSKPEPKSSKKEAVLDSDEQESEEESEEEDEETPAPAPAPPAKTVRKGADPLPSMPTPTKKPVSSRK
jgi:hypothetical protein